MEKRESKKWRPYSEALFAGGVVLFAQGLAEWFSVYWHWDYSRSVAIFIFTAVILGVAWFNRHESPSGGSE